MLQCVYQLHVSGCIWLVWSCVYIAGSLWGKGIYRTAEELMVFLFCVVLRPPPLFLSLSHSPKNRVLAPVRITDVRGTGHTRGCHTRAGFLIFGRKWWPDRRLCDCRGGWWWLYRDGGRSLRTSIKTQKRQREREREKGRERWRAVREARESTRELYGV